MGTDCAGRDRNNGKHAEVEKSAGQHRDWGGRARASNPRSTRPNAVGKSAFAQRTRNRTAVVLFPNQLLKHLLILRTELMAVLHHRVTPPVVQLV